MWHLQSGLLVVFSVAQSQEYMESEWVHIVVSHIFDAIGISTQSTGLASRSRYL